MKSELYKGYDNFEAERFCFGHMAWTKACVRFTKLGAPARHGCEAIIIKNLTKWPDNSLIRLTQFAKNIISDFSWQCDIEATLQT